MASRVLPTPSAETGSYYPFDEKFAANLFADAQSSLHERNWLPDCSFQTAESEAQDYFKQALECPGARKFLPLPQWQLIASRDQIEVLEKELKSHKFIQLNPTDTESVAAPNGEAVPPNFVVKNTFRQRELVEIEGMDLEEMTIYFDEEAVKDTEMISPEHLGSRIFSLRDEERVEQLDLRIEHIGCIVLHPHVLSDEAYTKPIDRLRKLGIQVLSQAAFSHVSSSLKLHSWLSATKLKPCSPDQQNVCVVM